MREIQQELERLRAKLRKLEQQWTHGVSPSPHIAEIPANQELPPWESVSTEASFEASLARIDAPAGGPPAPSDNVLWRAADSHDSRKSSIHEAVSGTVVETPLGNYFEAQTVFPYRDVHGNFALDGLLGMPPALLTALCPQHQGDPSSTWAFLDTETIGLAGGAGSFAFLIGLGSLDADGFRVRQFFLREPGEEASVLHALSQWLGRFRTLITYNGRSFDAPLLETRYVLSRQPIPFAEMPHLDLLHACRRLWKLRFESCKLTNLEREVLGFERVGDVPGFLIPSLYTNYLRTGDAGSLAAVFTHNALDILSLACLTNLVSSVFENPQHQQPRHPAECLGLGRWLLQLGRRQEAVRFLWRAANAAIPEDLLASTLWEIATAERQMGNYANSRRPLEQLLGFPNRFQSKALEALSILMERRLKQLPTALAFARQLEQCNPSEANAARIERLVKKLRGHSRQQSLTPGTENPDNYPRTR
ncbi:MAG: ribonuclease H-like domain-containing protein [Bryobacterales bacterium]|jgi:hypothetical protein|nr:ribonuclease H-like domain-containing protein [Bryobacterales bacterium]